MQSKILAVTLALSLCSSLYGSTAIVITTREGIVVGTDSKFSCFGVCSGTQGTIQKVQVVHDKILIATVGITGIEISKKAITEARARHEKIPDAVLKARPYDFPTWVREIERSTSPTISVTDLAYRIRNDVERRFVGMPFNNQVTIGNNGAGAFVVVGYENRAPNIFAVELIVDPAHAVIARATIKALGSKLFFAPIEAYSNAARALKRRDSCEYGRIRAMAPTELRAFESHTPSISQAKMFLHILISEEARIAPEAVGPPIYIGTIPYLGISTIDHYVSLAAAPKDAEKCNE